MASSLRELAEAMNAPLARGDPEMHELCALEETRQRTNLELIASENYPSRATREALDSGLGSKYCEGYPGARYYGGTAVVDRVERLCQARALAAFRLDPAEWGVNVQALSGSPANFAVYTALLPVHGRIMGLDLPHGGHLSHGFMSAKKRVSATSVYFESVPYRLDAASGRVDYDGLERVAELFRPQMLIAGASAYSRDFDYARMRAIADVHGAYLFADMAHIAGLVAAGVAGANPFEHSDVVTTTTHKTLRGPRAALIFYRRALEAQINGAVFPALQGGPHMHTIAAVAIALREAATPEFAAYQTAVMANAQALARALVARGYAIVSGGTDNHLMLLDLRGSGVDGARADAFLEEAGMTVNKNAVPGDTKPLVPGGIRLGTPALTTRGFSVADFERVADFLDRGLQLARALNAEGDHAKKLKSFKAALPAARERPEVAALRKEVVEFASAFPLPGEWAAR